MGSSPQSLGGSGNLELGELEQLTITNDNESSYDVSVVTGSYSYILPPYIHRYSHNSKYLRIVSYQILQITTPSQIRKTWNAKYTLRSHFDGVRALAFHPTEPVLITASEDQTLKLWNLQKVS